MDGEGQGFLPVGANREYNIPVQVAVENSVVGFEIDINPHLSIVSGRRGLETANVEADDGRALAETRVHGQVPWGRHGGVWSARVKVK